MQAKMKSKHKVSGGVLTTGLKVASWVVGKKGSKYEVELNSLDDQEVISKYSNIDDDQFVTFKDQTSNETSRVFYKKRLV